MEERANNDILSNGSQKTETERGQVVINLSPAGTYEESLRNMPIYIADPESPLVLMQIRQDDNNEEINLASLLRKCDLYEELFSFLNSKEITLDGLLYMKGRHLDELFAGKNFNMKVILEHKLGIWQNERGIYNLCPRLDADAGTGKPIDVWLSSITSPLNTISSPVNIISSPSTSSNIASEELTAISILNATEQGKALINSYNENGVLTPEDRTTVVHGLIQYYIENNIFLSVSKLRLLSEKIIRIFPTENQNTYFIARGKQAPKGKLWDRYQGRKRALKRLTSFCKPMKPYSLEKRMKTIIENENSCATDLPREELQEISVTLKHLRKWDEVIPKWKQTASYRKDILNRQTGITMQQILLDWPQYKYAQAPELIDIDYNYRFPTKQFSFIKWETFCTSAEQLFNKRIKDPLAKNMLKQLKLRKDTLNTDNLNILQAQLLHAILSPASNIINKKRVKHTISDSQMAFTLPVAQSNEIERTMAQKREECLQIKTTIQPFIVSGAEYNYSDFYVSMDDVKYKFNT